MDDIEVVQGNCGGGTNGLVGVFLKLCYLRTHLLSSTGSYHPNKTERKVFFGWETLKLHINSTLRKKYQSSMSIGKIKMFQLFLYCFELNVILCGYLY